MAYIEDRFSALMLASIAHRLQKGKKLVLLHGNADADAVGSAYALFRSFPQVTVGALGGLDKVSKIICFNLSFEVLESVDPRDFDYIVALDTSSPDQLGIDMKYIEDCIVIDHHSHTGNWPKCIYYSDESKRSCAEIIVALLEEVNAPIDKQMAIALMAGMLTDSGHFRYANADLLRSFSRLMDETDVNMDEVLSLTDLEPDISERISQLKGAQRLRFERIGGRIISISMGSAYESSVCKSLLSIGSDVAFVGSQRGDQFRLSARARPDSIRLGFHLGKMLEEVGSEVGSTGGGHAGAAGMSGIGDVEAILNICMSKAMDFFREKKLESMSHPE